MSFPQTRLSRLRASATLRQMVSEHQLTRFDLIQPVFVHHDDHARHPIASMPGQYQLGLHHLLDYLQPLYDQGLRAILLFGIPAQKDQDGCDTWNPQGVIQRALQALRPRFPEMLLITDVCFCEYTSHGHCGILKERQGQMVLDHDATLENLALQVVSHAQAGADMLAPSGMIDGQVQAIRQALDRSGFTHLPIMAYAAKYASAFYGPFRDAAQGAPQFGDRRSHQMNIANVREALREVEQDILEGADIVMVKPGLAYLDILRQVKSQFNIPTAIYNVSGEYAMVKAAAQNRWLEEKAIVLEILTAFKRAGADLIISYHTQDALAWL